MGMVFDAQKGDGVLEVMKEIRSKSMPALGASDVERARSLHWEGIAERLAVLYRG